MEDLKGIKGSLDHIKDNQSVLKKYLHIGNKLGFFETQEASETYTIYKQPAMINTFLFVLENLCKKHPQNRETKLPDFHTIQEAKTRMIEQYVVQLEERNADGELDELEKKAYTREVKKYKDILENIGQGSMDIMSGMNIVFVPQRWQELKNKNPDIMPHMILVRALEFIPKATDMIFNNLNDENVKGFLVENNDKIINVKPILEVFADSDNGKQNEILANMLLCEPDQPLANELVALAKQGKQNNDYYEFIYRLNNEIIKKLNIRAKDEGMAGEQIPPKERIQTDIKSLHEKGNAIGLDMIASPNLFLLPKGYIHIIKFIQKNPETLLTNIVKGVL